jgi:hypothetical protein
MTNPIVLRRTDSIGAADAENDHQFLSQCFVDSGQLDILLDCDKPQCVILGRTGSGKTALLLEVKKRVDNAIELSPEALSLGFLINSSVLSFFEEAGVHLDAFYKLLWQHVFCVELIKRRYQITNEERQRDFWHRCREFFEQDKAKEEALRYLEQWGRNFWEETTTRVKEFTNRLETELSANANVDLNVIKLGAKGVAKLSADEKAEVVNHGQRIVNNVHIRDLHNLINVLQENILEDRRRPFYILIDRLDENWVDDRIRFKLIRALIEAVRSFRSVRNVKVLVALRTDLLFSVLNRSVQPGFQTEKYEALYSRIPWSRDLLVRLLDLRTASLFRHRYTQETVKLEKILPPNQIEQRSATDYILDRTFFRPREAILFINECIARADGRARISVDILRTAEGTYSTKRMASLAEEWAHEYPLLTTTANIVQKRNARFQLRDIDEEDATKLMALVLEKDEGSRDPIAKAAKNYLAQSGADYRDFVKLAVCILYQAGLIGVKLAPHLRTQWSYLDEPVISADRLSETTDVRVHMTFWLTLNVTSRR